MSLKPGDIIEKYVVEDTIGQGAMATVYRVRHIQLKSLHALKVLHVHNESVKNRMIQEGMVQSGLRHPNIVAVTDIVEVNNAPGLVMELVEGPTLDRWLQDHRPSLDEAEALFLGILAGMEKAHSDGMIHRDLKPANILLAPVDGRWVPKIADFGLAKAQGRLVDYKATMTGVMMGTPAYMAPEQIKNAAGVDHRADIFSLGCLLYELVVGVVPFENEDWVEVLAAIRKGDYKRAKDVKPDIPERMSRAVDAALMVDFQARVSSVADLRAILLGEHAVRTYTPMVSQMPDRPIPVATVPEIPPPPVPEVPPEPTAQESIKRGLARGLIIGGVILLLALLFIVCANPQRGKGPTLLTPAQQAELAAQQTTAQQEADRLAAEKVAAEKAAAEKAAAEKAEVERLAEEARLAEEKRKAEELRRKGASQPRTPGDPPVVSNPPKEPVVVTPPAPVVPEVEPATLRMNLVDGATPVYKVTRGGKSYDFGSVPPGTYEVRYTYGAASGVKVVTLKSGEVVTVRCSERFKSCS